MSPIAQPFMALANIARQFNVTDQSIIAALEEVIRQIEYEGEHKDGADAEGAKRSAG